MGCMGIVYAATIAVEPAYCLREVRTLKTWDEVKADLLDGAVLRENRHYEVLVNPYAGKDGQHRCLVTTRNRVECGRPGAVRTRGLLVELTSAFPLTSAILNLVYGLWPRLAPRLIDQELKALVRADYEQVSYKVLNIGNANLLRAYSSEIGVPVEADTHVRAVERIFEVAAQRRRVGDAFHTSGFSLRFVNGSPAFAAMMHGRETMMIELILLTHTEGGMELLAAHEDALYALGGRPHWGQVNTLTGSHELIASMYPRWPDWLAVHHRFNASGVFDSPFSKRVGITAARFAAGAPQDAGRVDERVVPDKKTTFSQEKTPGDLGSTCSRSHSCGTFVEPCTVTRTRFGTGCTTPYMSDVVACGSASGRSLSYRCESPLSSSTGLANLAASRASSCTTGVNAEYWLGPAAMIAGSHMSAWMPTTTAAARSRRAASNASSIQSTSAAVRPATSSACAALCAGVSAASNHGRKSLFEPGTLSVAKTVPACFQITFSGVEKPCERTGWRCWPSVKPGLSKKRLRITSRREGSWPAGAGPAGR
jgi:hypothetical protein